MPNSVIRHVNIDGTTYDFGDASYDVATQSTNGLMSSTDKIKLDGISSEANKANIAYDATNKKITKTIDGTTTDVVTVATLKTDLQLAKGDVGLGNIDNTSDVDKPISTATQTALNGKLDTTLKGAVSGLAELDENGKVPSSQLPSYVDDVAEYSSSSAFPLTGENGKIYVALDTNLTYRWSGSEYVEISASLALGETSSTAYRGDRGKIAYDHASDASKLSTAKTSGLYKISTTAEGHVSSVTEVQKSDITGLGIPAQDTTYSEFLGSGENAASGLVPSPGTTAGTAKYLREDGGWQVPPDTTYTNGAGLNLSGTTFSAKLSNALNSSDAETALNLAGAKALQDEITNVLKHLGLVYYNNGLYVDPDQ